MKCECTQELRRRRLTSITMVPRTDLDGHPELDLLAKALSFSSPSLRVSTRMELYSCKSIKSEKRLFRVLEKDLTSDLAHSTSISPPENHPALLQSAFGPLDQKDSRKTLWLLIATLNLAFPDHDFSRVRPEEFSKEESARAVLSSLSSALSHLRASGSDSSYYRTFSSYPPGASSTLPGFPKAAKVNSSALQSKLRELSGSEEMPTHPFLRQVLDPIIELADCDVYSYTPDLDSDPHAYQSEDEEDYSSPDDNSMADDADDDVTGTMDGVTPSYPGTPVPSAYQDNLQRQGRSHSSARWRDSYADGLLFDEDMDSLSSNAQDPSGQVEGSDETGGLLWSSNFFFYNRKMRRILFVSCWGRKIGSSPIAGLHPHVEKLVMAHPSSSRSTSQAYPSLLSTLRSEDRPFAPYAVAGSAPASSSSAFSTRPPLPFPGSTDAASQPPRPAVKRRSSPHSPAPGASTPKRKPYKRRLSTGARSNASAGGLCKSPRKP